MENPGFKYGLYGGLTAMVFTLVMYNVNAIQLFNGPMAYGIPILIYAGSVLMSLREFSATQDPPVNFRDLMRIAFPAVLLAMGMNHFLHFLLLWMDAGLPAIHKAGLIELAQQYGPFMTDEQGLQRMIMGLEAFDGKRSFGQAFGLYFRSIIPAFFMAALISLFFIRRA